MRPATTFHDDVQQILEHLDKAFERTGRSRADVARTLGLYESFFSERSRRTRFDIGVLMATLRELGIPPADFFAELEGDADGGGGVLSGPDSIFERSTPDTRRAVGRCYLRMRAELAGVDLVPQFQNLAADEVLAATSSLRLGVDWLVGLDARRQDEPEVVAAELAASLEQVETALLPRALGIWSSALRLALDLETAAYLNQQAVRLAEAAGDAAAVADLLIRRSYIAADAGDHRAALTLAEIAAGIFARLGAEAGEGRALVDAARWLHYLNRNRESITAHRRALALLRASEPQYRIAALHCLGLVHLELDEVDEAETCADLAAPLLELAAGPLDRGKLPWLRALICRKRGRLAESEALFRQVVEIFTGLHLGEAALASLELVEVILGQGKTREAWQVCVGMFPLEDEGPIIGAAVGELIRAGVGGLHLERVRHVKAQLENAKRSAKTRRAWRALAVAD